MSSSPSASQPQHQHQRQQNTTENAELSFLRRENRVLRTQLETLRTRLDAGIVENNPSVLSVVSAGIAAATAEDGAGSKTISTVTGQYTAQAARRGAGTDCGAGTGTPGIPIKNNNSNSNTTASEGPVKVTYFCEACVNKLATDPSTQCTRRAGSTLCDNCRGGRRSCIPVPLPRFSPRLERNIHLAQEIMDKADKATHEEKLAQRRAARALKAVLEKYRAETKLPVEPKQREVRMYDLKRRKVEALEELVELGRMTLNLPPASAGPDPDPYDDSLGETVKKRPGQTVLEGENVHEGDVVKKAKK